MEDGVTYRSACPACGAQATYYADSRGDDWYWCPACMRALEQQKDAFKAAVRVRCPELSERTANMLYRHFGTAITSLWAASDDELLCVRNFGQKALAEFRAAWPVPIADAAADDPWRDHAEMVALAGGV